MQIEVGASISRTQGGVMTQRAATGTRERTVGASPASFRLGRPPRNLWKDALRGLSRNKMSVAGVVVIGLMILLAVLAPVLPLHDPLYMSRKTDPGGGGTTLPPV